MSDNKNHEGMFETQVEGVTLATRAPFAEFPDEFQAEFKRLCAFHRDHVPTGWALNRVVVDHVNLKAQTYQPRVDLDRI